MRLPSFVIVALLLAACAAPRPPAPRPPTPTPTPTPVDSPPAAPWEGFYLPVDLAKDEHWSKALIILSPRGPGAFWLYRDARITPLTADGPVLVAPALPCSNPPPPEEVCPPVEVQRAGFDQIVVDGRRYRPRATEGTRILSLQGELRPPRPEGELSARDADELTFQGAWFGGGLFRFRPRFRGACYVGMLFSYVGSPLEKRVKHTPQHLSLLVGQVSVFEPTQELCDGAPLPTDRAWRADMSEPFLISLDPKGAPEALVGVGYMNALFLGRPGSRWPDSHKLFQELFHELRAFVE